MKKIHTTFFGFLALCILFFTEIAGNHEKHYSHIFVKNNQTVYDSSWTIIGAGPAGIIVVGLLLDLGIKPSDITWIDPEFNVGRLSAYANVPANTKTQLFINFIESCKTFQQCNSPAVKRLYTYQPDKEYPLHIITEPLQDITTYLLSKVNGIRGSLEALQFDDNCWHVGIEKNSIKSEHVVLATGSHPCCLNYPCEKQIPLDIALNKNLLEQQVCCDDSIAVIGGSHSAILLLKNLCELRVKRIINFYKKPIQYAVDMGTWMLHNANGLKGIAAEWARDVLEKTPPANLIRLYNCPETIDAWLPVCNKIIYAIGFERNSLPPINNSNDITYDDRSGIIAPRLFGIGIAFPEQYTDPLGNQEHRVGLNSFMDYAQRVLPLWISQETRSRLAFFDQLFTIEVL